jgi:preprotein translocase subunit SecF
MDIVLIAGILSALAIIILIAVPLVRFWRRRRSHW